MCVRKENIKRLTTLLLWVALFLGAAYPCRAVAIAPESESTDPLVLYFPNNSSLLMRDYRTNGSELDRLDRILSRPEITFVLDSIIIQGAASTTGSYLTNERLAQERAGAVRSYIRWKHPHVDAGKIRIVHSVFNWNELRERVQQDRQVPYREEVLRILTAPLDDESKARQIKKLGNGTVEKYITDHFARYMRSATSLSFFLVEEQDKNAGPGTAEQLPGSVPDEEQKTEEDLTIQEPVTETDTPDQVSEDNGTQTLFVRPLAATERKPLFAVKTNLLYDLGSAINLEVEVPIGQRWSVAAEWIFPWWLWNKKQCALEVLNGNIEGRYWFGDRVRHAQLTGWFTGIYVGAGYYDVEWKTKGCQGEFISAGITGGYAHKISRNWRMEYSLGVGYMGTKYREYIPQKCGLDDEWHLIKQRSGRSTWVGPTRAKVSLVWMINSGHNKK